MMLHRKIEQLAKFEISLINDMEKIILLMFTHFIDNNINITFKKEMLTKFSSLEYKLHNII